jgi:hypothetical protein
MTVQAFAIVVGVVKMDILGRGNMAKILNIDVPQPAQLGPN